MRRHLLGPVAGLSLTACTLAVLGVPCAHARFLSQYTISLGRESLGVIDDQARWDGSRENLWILEETDKGCLIRLNADEKRRQWYLTYDHTGESKKVSLSRKPGAGSYWAVPMSGLGSSRGSIHPWGGKLKDWSLDIGVADEKHGGKHVILSKRGRECEVTVISK